MLPVFISSVRCSSRCRASLSSLATALPHGDDERGREEDADLAEFDLFGFVVVPRGDQDDQPDVFAVQLGLRPQALTLRILDREFMQPEGRLHLGELLRVRLEQAQPDKPTVAGPGRCVRTETGASCCLTPSW